MPPHFQPKDVKKHSVVLREYQKETLAQHGSTQNNIITFTKYDMIWNMIWYNKYDVKRKTSRYFQRLQMAKCSTPLESS